MSEIIKRVFSFFLALIAAITGLFGSPSKPEGDLVVELSANPSTGYSWVVTMDKDDVVNLKSRSYKSDKVKPGIVGAGGVEIFCFEAVKDGEVKITFNYCRTWEENSAIRTVVYTCVSSGGKITVDNIYDSDLIVHIAA